MQFEVSEQQRKRAKIPHEIFLINLVAVHILWFVAALGIAKSLPQPIIAMPIMSASILIYILWRAKKALQDDEDWFVKCHWQMAAKRARVFIGMLSLLVIVSALGWVGYTYLGMMQIAVMAFIGGAGILPIMVTVLGLIIMESDSMHQASQGKLGKAIVEKFPNPGLKVLEE